MSDLAKAVERYLAAWNETDPAGRHAIVAETWAPGATHIDPLVEVKGRQAIEETIGAVRAEFPDFVFTLAGPVDGHHDIARFTWHLGPAGGEPVMIGSEVMVLGRDGRISALYGFFDKVSEGLRHVADA